MKREILFRGRITKQQDIDLYGKFWYGDLIHYADGSMAIRQIETGMELLVDPETIGQFTGLLDLNGMKIFEGDILKIVTDKLMVVEWSDKFASFILNRSGWAFSHWFGESCNPEDCEVIGNMDDNPELLS